MSALHRRTVSSTRSSRSKENPPSINLNTFPFSSIPTNRFKPRHLMPSCFISILRRYIPILRGYIHHTKLTLPRVLCVCLILLYFILYLISHLITYGRSHHNKPLVCPPTTASMPLWERQQSHRRVIPIYETLDQSHRKKLEVRSMSRLRKLKERLSPLVAKKAPLDDGMEVEEVKQPARRVKEPKGKTGEEKAAHEHGLTNLQDVQLPKSVASQVENDTRLKPKPKPKGKGKPKPKPKGGKSKHWKHKEAK
ncbi:BZ3500_MvSof-1268-A1-R1_Chr1-3g01709 [Microbotryum saponariae]|uniref:BZ3500_MvSof-1268-A1-R1_Chr1-3g01709 protein n=1 Tax=Microbotryum saponariae TaxID=289078 RepID=A0A2X0L6H4_9BASI|nr:BZ3500_MvSof-1268-A1-R1_Chr1-3g01709 [Microbotryum saponariae]SCZ94391.1 BZ3501_MvSof-1269-A2-R1_Chr1-3g01310 [Microbotryum saponariae]